MYVYIFHYSHVWNLTLLPNYHLSQVIKQISICADLFKKITALDKLVQIRATLCHTNLAEV